MRKEERAFLTALADRLLAMEKRLDKLERYVGGRALKKAAKYDEIVSLPPLIGLSVSKVVPFWDEAGTPMVRVSFQVPDRFIRSPDIGDVDYDEAIIAMNALDMLSLDDQDRISDVVKRHFTK